MSNTKWVFFYLNSSLLKLFKIYNFIIELNISINKINRILDNSCILRNSVCSWMDNWREITLCLNSLCLLIFNKLSPLFLKIFYLHFYPNRNYLVIGLYENYKIWIQKWVIIFFVLNMKNSFIDSFHIVKQFLNRYDLYFFFFILENAKFALYKFFHWKIMGLYNFILIAFNLKYIKLLAI